MLTEVFPARVVWSDRTSMPGRVTMNYLADVDPWLVHMTFEVRSARDEIDVERYALMHCVTNMMMGGQWIGSEGSRLRMGRSGKIVHLLQGGVDFEVDWNRARSFVVKTVELCDLAAEAVAMDSYVNQSLEKFTDE